MMQDERVRLAGGMDDAAVDLFQSSDRRDKASSFRARGSGSEQPSVSGWWGEWKLNRRLPRQRNRHLRVVCMLPVGIDGLGR